MESNPLGLYSGFTGENLLPSPKPLPPLEVLNEWFTLDETRGVLYYAKKPARRIRTGSEAGWKQNHNGLLRVSVVVPGHGRYLRSRVIWKMVKGTEPPRIVDHKDRNPLNDAPENLRDGTNGLNQRNKAVRAASGLAGAFTYPKRNGRWTSTIQVNGKTVYLGIFKTAEEANSAYLAARAVLDAQTS